MIRPLEGMLVVTLEHAVAGPLASRHLADLGATVIKIERPGGGDFARGYDSAVYGMSSFFVWLNRGKQSLTLDLKAEAAREILDRLIARADVVLQNLAPGAAARLGLSHAALEPKNPRIVVCDISGYGESGPYARKKAYDLLVQAESGLISINGTPETPARVGISIADIATGMYAQSAILAALLRRERTGAGAEIKIAMLDALTEWVMYAIYRGAYGGEAPPRDATSHPLIAPYGAHRSKDGSVIFGIQNEREWAAFCERVLERPDLAKDPRFADNSARRDHRAELTAAIEEVFTTMPSSEVVARLDAAGIANGRLNDVHDVWKHPALEARKRWRDLAIPGATVRGFLPPFDISGFEPRMDPVPALGADTDRILTDLGYDAGRIAALRQAGTV